MNNNNDILYETLHQKLCEDMLDNENSFLEKKPLLAHYTSIENFENILKNNNIWFSNPLYMNDLEEIRFGVLEGHKLFISNENLERELSIEIYEKLIENFNHYFNEFSNAHAIDVYAFCLTEHDPEKDDNGKLSMWRGYGGNGSGVAIVFDTKKMGDTPDNPLIIASVEYKSNRERIDWINAKIDKFIEYIKEMNFTRENIYLAAHALFQRLLVFALFTKHKGFEEEKEWRLVYVKHWVADYNLSSRLENMLSYHFGKRGIEPKFILPIEPMEGIISEGITLENMIESIIVGPTISNQLTQQSIKKMLKKLGKEALIDKLKFSDIPFRG